MRPLGRLDRKWLKVDLQSTLNRDGLIQLWNEMMRDGELTRPGIDAYLNANGVPTHRGLYSIFDWVLLGFPSILMSIVHR